MNAISFALGLTLLAQDPSPSAQGFGDLKQRTSVLRQSHGVSWQHGQLRGGGPGYRVVFSAGDVTFTPALGRRAARSYPLALSMQSVRRGDLEAAIVADATPNLAANAVTYQHAPGVRERWEVRPDGVALSYVLDARPEGRGDLVVRLGVTSDLQLESSASDGVHLAAEGLGGVRIGGVTGIDADGMRVSGALRCDGLTLELSLPERFVQDAVYPLVLDPLIGTSLSAGGPTLEERHPDVAYDADQGVYLVVWHTVFSISDVEVRAQRLDTAAVLVGGQVAVTSLSAEVAFEPVVSNVALTDRFMVAWQQGPSILGPWDIFAACVDAAAGPASANVAMSTAPADEIDLAAGSDHSSYDADALLVWHEVNGGIRGAQVKCGAFAPPAGGPIVEISTDPADVFPAMSRNGGELGRHAVTWHRRGMGIHAALFDRGSGLLSPGQLVAPEQVYFNRTSVDGDGIDFLVVYDRPEGFVLSPRDIHGQKLSFDPVTGGLVSVGSETTLAADLGQHEYHPAVAFLGSKYAVAWSTETGGFLTTDLEVQTFGLEQCRVCGPRSVVGATRGFNGYPALASMLSGGGTDDQGLVVFMSADFLPPLRSEVLAQRVQAMATGGTVISQGGGCGSPGVLSIEGPLALANSSFAFRLDGADPSASSAVLVFGTLGAPVPCGTCAILPPVVAVPVPLVGVSARQPLPIPCAWGLFGAVFDAQWWVIGTATTPCPFAPNVSFTDVYRAQIGV